MTNEERIYKDYVSQTFNRTALSYDHVGPRFFTHFGKCLVELAGVYSGVSILDVGCGRGAILFPAAEKAGPAGEVIGIDIAETMLQLTANDIEHLGLTNASVCQMDAEALRFPAARFDFAFYGFVLYEFYDLALALSEAFRVLKPNGIFAASVWGKKLDTRWDGFRSIVKSYRDQLKPAPEAKNIPRLRDPADVEVVLSKAGFRDFHIEIEEKEFFFINVEEWWAFEWSHGNRFLWERMEPPVLERCRSELFEVIGPMKQEAGIPIVFQVLLTRAVNLRMPSR